MRRLVRRFAFWLLAWTAPPMTTFPHRDTCFIFDCESGDLYQTTTDA